MSDEKSMPFALAPGCLAELSEAELGRVVEAGFAEMELDDYSEAFIIGMRADNRRLTLTPAMTTEYNCGRCAKPTWLAESGRKIAAKGAKVRCDVCWVESDE